MSSAFTPSNVRIRRCRSAVAAIALCLSSFASLSQHVPIDTLQKRIMTFSGAAKASALHELVFAYLRTDLKKAALTMKEVDDWSRYETDAETRAYLELTKGVYFARTGSLDSSLYFLDRAKEHASRANASHALLRVYSALGTSYVFDGQPEKGLDQMFAALRLIEKYPDAETEMKVHTNIAWAYLELKRFRDCVTQGRKNIQVMEGTAYEWIALYTYNNIAVCYGGLRMLDSARYYIEKGIQASLKNGDNQSLANAYFILGTIYSEAGEYGLAIEQYLNARPYREKVGNPLFIVSDLYTIAGLYAKTREYRKGVEVAKEALALVERYDLQMKYDWTYLALAENYEGLGDFRNASRYYRLWAVAKDSAYRHASADAIAEMQTRYETEKKEQQLILQKAQLAEQSAKLDRTNIIVMALVMTLLLFVVIFLLLRSRQKRKRELALREAQIHATIESQETERRRFAQDLHDGMGQMISALRLTLHRIHDGTPLEERVNIVSKAEALLNDMHKEIRSIAFNLMPQTLVQHGLAPALKEMSGRITDSGKVAISVTCFDIPERLESLHEISLYRIIQEWINNIVKHAGASVVGVQLVGYDDEVTVIIEDDGRGFDLRLLETNSGNGWKNIRSRVNLIGASVDIDSQAGKSGTTLIIHMPMKRSLAITGIPAQANTRQHG